MIRTKDKYMYKGSNLLAHKGENKYNQTAYDRDS